MKKSECYKLAQVAVAECEGLSAIEKVETLKVLINDESLALFVEEQKRMKELTEGAE